MKKLKCGDVREDGRIFWSTCLGREKWFTPEAYLKRCESRNRIQEMRRRRGLGPTKQQQASYERAYKARNPHTRILHALARGQRKGSKVRGDQSFIKQFYVTRDRLRKCTGFAWHVDHILALANGGAHHENNLQVIPATLNLRKGRKPYMPALG